MARRQASAELKSPNASYSMYRPLRFQQCNAFRAGTEAGATAGTQAGLRSETLRGKSSVPLDPQAHPLDFAIQIRQGVLGPLAIILAGRKTRLMEVGVYRILEQRGA